MVEPVDVKVKFVVVAKFHNVPEVPLIVQIPVLKVMVLALLLLELKLPALTE